MTVLDVTTVSPCNGSADDGVNLIPYAKQFLGAGGGEFYLPPGARVTLRTPLPTLSASIGWRGAVASDCTISAGGIDQPVLTFAGQRSELRNVTVIGNGSPGWASAGFGATQPALVFAPGSSDSHIDNVYVTGGAIGIVAHDADIVFNKATVTCAYGSALAYTSAGVYWNRCKMDQGWPAGMPNGAIGSWTASTVVPAKAVITLGGYVVQCTQGGTTGATAPALANYLTPIADGTAQWQLVSSVNMASMVFVGGQEAIVDQTDLSCCGQYGIVINNFINLQVRGSTIGQQSSHGVLVQGQSRMLKLNGNKIGAGWTSGASGVVFDQSYTGDNAQIVGGNTIAGGYIGVDINGGSNLTIHGNGIYGASNAGIYIDRSAYALITGNDLSPNPAIGANGTGVYLSANSAGCYVAGNLTGNGNAGVTGPGIGAAGNVVGQNC